MKLCKHIFLFVKFDSPFARERELLFVVVKTIEELYTTGMVGPCFSSFQVFGSLNY
jgi:hypothetical protein